MEVKNFLSYKGLQTYDENIKAYINGKVDVIPKGFMIVTFTSQSNNMLSADKTVEEILRAYNNGTNVVGSYLNTVFVLSAIEDNSLSFSSHVGLLDETNHEYIATNFETIFMYNDEEIYYCQKLEQGLDNETYSSLTTENKTVIGAINELDAELNTHNHDDMYYTESEVDAKIDSIPNYVVRNIEDVTRIAEKNKLVGFYFYLNDPLPNGLYYYDYHKYQGKVLTAVIVNKEGTAVDKQFSVFYPYLLKISSDEENVIITCFYDGGITQFCYDIANKEYTSVDKSYNATYIDKKFSDLNTSITEQLALKAESSHNHDDIYYTKTEVDTVVEELEAQLDEKVAPLATTTALNAVQEAVDELVETHSTDKTALEGAIELKADQTALDAVSAVANAAVKQSDYDVKVKALEDEDSRIAGLVATEAERAAGVESGLDTRLVKVETFFELADGEKLDEAKDTLIEIQKIIDADAEVADTMLKDIAANAKAIEDHEKIDHNFTAADDALKAELEGKINAKADTSVVEGINGRVGTAEGKITTVEDKVSTLEGQMTVVQGAVATKAEAQDLTDAVAALEGADADLDERLQAVEAQLGDGENSVSDLISDAKQEAIDAAAEDATTKSNKALEDAKKYADEEDAKIESRVDALEAASETHALAADLTVLTGRVTTAEGKISTLETEMDAVENKASDNEAAIGTINTELTKKAEKTDLEAAITRISTNEGAISTINTTLADKAEQEDLDDAVERITAVEAKAASNESAINSFVAITVDEINALFA